MLSSIFQEGTDISEIFNVLRSQGVIGDFAIFKYDEYEAVVYTPPSTKISIPTAKRFALKEFKEEFGDDEIKMADIEMFYEKSTC